MVVVIAGKDKGPKAHRVLRVIVDKQRVLVEGVGMIKKHMKPNPQKNIAGGHRHAAVHEGLSLPYADYEIIRVVGPHRIANDAKFVESARRAHALGKRPGIPIALR